MSVIYIDNASLIVRLEIGISEPAPHWQSPSEAD